MSKKELCVATSGVAVGGEQQWDDSLAVTLSECELAVAAFTMSTYELQHELEERSVLKEEIA